MLESKRRAIIFIGLSLLLAVLAGVLLLHKVKDLNKQLGETTPVFIAKASIASRELIKPEQVTTMQIPKKYVTSSYITNVNDLVNKVSVVPLNKDDVITKNMLKPAATVSNEKDRLVSVPASEKINFDQPLEALDRVDIVVSHKFDGKPKTELFMRDIPVAMVYKADNGNTKAVSLVVPLQDAPKLIHMENYADNVRILKANVGKEKEPLDTKPAQSNPAPNKSTENKPAPAPAAAKPSAGSNGPQAPKK